MVFEWEEEKFADPFAISRDDYMETEHRRQIMGHIGDTLLVLVVYAMRDKQGEEVFRIISARKTTPAERRKYEAGKWL